MRNEVFVVLIVGIVGCGTKESSGTADTLSVRQRDSVLGASQLPGAQGIRGALRVSDSAAARRDREDRTGQ